MLNISNNSVSKAENFKHLHVLKRVESKRSKRLVKRVSLVVLLLLIIIAFLPWTQNIRTNGKVTTLKPDQRPQSINTVIAGRIEKWYVQEGDLVKKGDTIAFISEVKDNYFDPLLLPRTQDQLTLKESTTDAYDKKASALNQQVMALGSQLNLKLQQAKNKLLQAELKVERDSIAYVVAQMNFKTATNQAGRTDSLFFDGLKSKTDAENRGVKAQQAKSYEMEAKNKWLTSKNEQINSQVEIRNITAKYDTDVAKIQADIFTALSSKYDSESMVAKLENQYANYALRQGMYYILAPQDAYIAKLVTNGLGEVVKEGSPVVHIVPTNYELAVELFVAPIDLPLLKINQEVRIIFDGWPAIVFSGWPNANYGTYSGVVYGIDMYLGLNGKYRVLVKPNPNAAPWPKALRYGGGTNNMILLEDVFIFYEIWRKINGFPPNFYTQENTQKSKK
ncbi:biotin attachment protein [Putridiphycobacter roseus]|uniref:Biotin attachment protein n=1 Tax=Putridiphycobacter roseus TaxID=2219161 RepID=A0A2W1NF33_9FLAO|nr:HlyD family efflux transporter periplasmic adaptor subunit [Putridiphycobacter roseus]PZE18085.1 biotin attachment protein [Putridiphycobacter roseus]